MSNPDRRRASLVSPDRLASSKVRNWHLDRNAIVYVRQSTPQQVAEHQESTARQYALVDRAAQLGWLEPRVLVIDEDLGRSGKSIEGRPGFQRLLTEVALDRVGLILGLEMSRLARSCKDWHQLLELCGRFHTLLADAEGVYDPTDYNDRLLLGLKGTMNEAELHVLKERMYQGKLNKARRGELVVAVPVGYVKHPGGEVTLDPDEQVQSVVRLLFDEFDRQQTIHGVLRYMNANGIRMPVRVQNGPQRGQLEWRPPSRETLRQILHHPIYAGAYRYGHRPVDPRRQKPGRRNTGRVWGSVVDGMVLLKDRMPAYIDWERFEANQQRLAANRARAESPGAIRSGSAILAGLVWCGRCGRRMYVRYRGRRQRASYVCSTLRSDYGLPLCQSLAAEPLETWVAGELLAAMQPAALAASITAVAEVEQQHDQLTKHWQQRLQRAGYDVERAVRQYHAVEPENRLVARALEQHWEEALREQQRLQAEFERFEQTQPRPLSAKDAKAIERLADKVPALWQAPTTTPEDRRQIARLLLERVVVRVDSESERLDAQIEWAGGAQQTQELRRVVGRYEQQADYPRLVARLQALHQQGLTAAKIADKLNSEGFRPLKHSSRFQAGTVCKRLTKLGLRSPRIRRKASPKVLAKSEWWLTELATHLGLSPHTLHGWRKRGWIQTRQAGGRGGPWIIWANEKELKRFEQLRDCPRLWRNRERLAKLRKPTITRYP